MKNLDPKTVIVVIVALGVIGLIIQLPSSSDRNYRSYNTQESRITPHTEVEKDSLAPSSKSTVTDSRTSSNRETSIPINESPVVRAKTAEELAAERAAQAELERKEFLDRYVNLSVMRPHGKKLVAFVVSSENGNSSGLVNAALSKRLKTNSIEVTGSLLKGSFVNDGLFNQVFGGSLSPLEKLELAKNADALFLARQAVKFTKNPNLENVITASMTVETQLIMLGATIVAGGWTFQSTGAGFTESDARLQAEERLVKQIEKDTNLKGIE